MKQVLLLLCFLISLNAQAVTYVYFQNNTSLAYSIERSQYGTHIMSPGEWGFTGNSIGAWQLNTEVMWSNRDQGVHNGDDFYFDIKLKSGGDSVTLKVKLRGNFTSSSMWQSAAGPGFSHAWFNDRNFHTASFVFAGKQMTLKYKAKFTGGDDDIYYALQEENPFPVLASDTANANIFNVLAYNIYMLTPPVSYSDQTERAAEMYKHIRGYDCIIFSEAFYNSARDNNLIPGISPEYPYRTPVVDEGTFNEDGGVFIASRWPIDTFAQIVFTNCDGNDCLAAKGVMYARIRKHGKAYHVFGTHTQAWNSAQNVATRVLQLKQMKNFINSLNIPANEPVIIGGDLNVDKIVNNLNEYNRMLDSLNVLEPTYTGHPYTYDAGLSYYTTTGDEYLDYVFTQNNHFSPATAVNKPIILRSIADPMWGLFDLSDHFAVQGRFVFPAVVQQPLTQTVCDQDLVVFRVELSVAASYQWFYNGVPIPGANNDSLVLGATFSDAGDYHCIMTYNNGTIQSNIAELTVLNLPTAPTITRSGDTLYSSSPTGNQWYNDNGIIPGATNNFYVPTTMGNYYVNRNNGICTSPVSAPFAFLITNIQPIEKGQVRLFPNPSANILNLEIGDEMEDFSWKIYSINGAVLYQVVSTKSGNLLQIDISNLSKGLYLLKIENKGQFKTHKFLKE